ncbi:MAG: sugar phosphate nucleotidyltransferase [Myxococcales bacterium]|nr:sugar phosphate nucleotidyltransferase [Myxococcales bacterium]MDH3485976.1 sugar phosphate nucleotidyltransferase [Myxococcales bacterium]
MKVVIFCGGFGTRLREHSETIPKPLVNIGYRPILWHLMKYYAHYGHKEFILCLGYGADLIKQYFLDYNPYLSGDVTINPGGKLTPAKSDIADWRIHLVDTGLNTNIGGRLMAVRQYVESEEMFLANYGDGLSDLPLDDHIERFRRSKAVAGFAAVQPSHQSFHTVHAGNDGLVTQIEPMASADLWINGGYMVLRREVFDYMRPGEELVEQPFERMLAEKKLFTLKYEGFWKAMDTFKDKVAFDQMDASGDRPWEIWTSGSV